MVHLHDPETHLLGKLLKKYEDLSFLGSELDFDTLIKVATCEVCPLTKKPFREILFEKLKKDQELKALSLSRQISNEPTLS